MGQLHPKWPSKSWFTQQHCLKTYMSKWQYPDAQPLLCDHFSFLQVLTLTARGIQRAAWRASGVRRALRLQYGP